MTDQIPVVGTLLDDQITFSFAELCRCCGLQSSELIAIVEEGLLHPQGGGLPEHWHFPAPALRRLRTILRLHRELEIDLPGAALALTLLEELQELRARIRALEYQYQLIKE